MKEGHYTLATKMRVYIDTDPLRWGLALAAAAVVEVWLARREKWWPGLILPGASFLWTLGCLLVSYGVAPAFLETLGISGLMLLQKLLWNNLPTLALLAVYAVCRLLRRRKCRRERELDKTRVDDL